MTLEIKGLRSERCQWWFDAWFMRPSWDLELEDATLHPVHHGKRELTLYRV